MSPFSLGRPLPALSPLRSGIYPISRACGTEYRISSSGFIRIHKEAVIKIFHILFIANSLIILYALGQHFFGIPAIYKPLFFMKTAAV